MPFNRLNRGKALSRIQNSYNAVSNTITSATGGIISDYDDGSGNKYRAHIFTSTGALTVNTVTPGINPATVSYNPTSIDYRRIGGVTTLGDSVEYLVVAGGGGGGADDGGGGGAGGFH